MCNKCNNKILNVISYSLLIVIFFSLLNINTKAHADENGIIESKSRLQECCAIYEEEINKKEQLDKEKSDLEEKIKLNEENLIDQQKKANEIIVNKYKFGNEMNKLFISCLNQNSFSDIVKNIDYYNQIIDYKNDVLNEVNENKNNLMNDKENLDKIIKEQEESLNKAELAKKEAEVLYAQAQENAKKVLVTSNFTGEWFDAFMTLSEFKFRGEVIVGEDDNKIRYTYYSELVLPGGGLVIPGRHVGANGCVCDEDGYIVCASGEIKKGEIVPTPLGPGKIYDYCETPGTIDIYIH